MKFSDGFWRPADGLTSIFALAAHGVTMGDGTVTVHAPTRPVESRRNSLNNPVISVTLWSPAENAVGVRIDHHRGTRPRTPAFDLDVDPTWRPEIVRTDEEIALYAGDVSVHVSLLGGWAMTFRRGSEVLTRSDLRSIAVAQASDGSRFTYQRLLLPEADLVYGLGERSTPLVKNGQSIDTWNEDGGPSSWHSYKAIPFFLTDRGWGVLVNSPGRVQLEVGSEFVSQVQFSVPGGSLEYVVLADESPKGVLTRYTGLTGRPPVPPAWSFGLWLSSSFVTDYDERTMVEFADKMAALDIPLSVAHLDSFWMREFRWCDFEWDPERFPEPERMLRELHERGLRTCVWINPYIAEQSPLFDEGAREGYLLRRPNGDVWQWDTWQAGMAIVDFTNPAARQWYADKLTRLFEMGVDCVKTDFGERIPLDVVFHDGSDPARMHNYYSYLYNETVFTAIERAHGAGQGVVFARAATVGGQKFPVHWGGDPEPTYVSMAESVRAGLSLGMSGFGFWSHDIGGFEGEPTPDVFMRWLAFGLLSSHSRLHGSVGHRVPWAFGERAVDVTRRFTRLKMRLMPYIYGASIEAHQYGWPVMRAMALEFPEDRSCAHLDRQYMLGGDLLVAPVMRADGAVRFYVPAGTWTDLLSGERLVGPSWHEQHHDVDSLPVLVRPGAIMPTGSREDRPDYDHRDGVVLECYEARSGTRREVVVADPSRQGPAARFQVGVEADVLTTHAATDQPWRLLLVGEDAVIDVDGGTARPTGRGVEVVPDEGSAVVRVRLSPSSTVRPIDQALP